jgi:hypothetical protein
MRRPTLAPVVAVVLAVVLLFGGYMGAYFLLGSPHRYTGHCVRTYRQEWQAIAFVPAAILEAAITDTGVTTEGTTGIRRPRFEPASNK